jgi:hypothetical protein
LGGVSPRGVDPEDSALLAGLSKPVVHHVPGV